MKNLVVFFLLVVSFNVSAIELLGYKDSSSSLTILTEESVSKAWAAGPACIKSRSKIVGVNRAFKEKRLGFSDCSNSDETKRIHAIRGFNVTVMKLGELPDSILKQIVK